jgi:hypothetical protein
MDCGLQSAGNGNAAAYWRRVGDCGSDNSPKAGVPIIFCRRISIDTQDRVVEVSDADYLADRAELQFVTPLKPWPKKRLKA